MLSPQRPFDPARLPFFYGWLVLAVAAIGVLASIPGQTMGVSVFTDHLLAATGMSRVELANAYLVGTLASGVSLPFGGRLLDRYGSRLTAMGSCALLGTTLLFLSALDSVGGTLERVVPFGMFATATFGFACLRFSGQGMLTLSSRTMFVKWFAKKRGLASGLMSVVVTLGFSVAPLVLAWWIDSAGGWRMAWITMGAVVGLGMGVLAWALYRDDPESSGLFPDGADAPPSEDSVIDERAATVQTALRAPSFWIVVLTLCIQSTVITGITFHIVDIGATVGMSRDASVGLFPPIAFVSVFTALFGGAISDKIRLRPVVLTMLAAESVGLLGFAQLDESAGWWLAVFGIGVSSGLFGTLASMGLATLFGRRHIGGILSAQMSALVIGSALGPALLAFSRQVASSYAPALHACAAIPLLVAASALLVRDPRPDGRAW